MCRLVSGPPSGQQGHSALQLLQVGPEHDPVALQQREAPAGPHEAAESLIHAAVSRVYQLLLWLRDRDKQDLNTKYNNVTKYFYIEVVKSTSSL